MSGWHVQDRKMAEDVGDDMPAYNNITIRGYLPTDEVRAPMPSRNIVEAHQKSLRLFRRWCRFTPFIVTWAGARRFASPEAAKLNMANHWR